MKKQLNTARNTENHIGVQRLLIALAVITVLVNGAEITGYISIGKARWSECQNWRLVFSLVGVVICCLYGYGKGWLRMNRRTDIPTEVSEVQKWQKQY